MGFVAVKSLLKIFEILAEAAEKRREFAELQYHNLLMAGAFQKTDLEW